MLSTLSSFLPSALSDRLDKLDLRSDDSSNKQQIEVLHEGMKQLEVAEDSNKREKKKKSSSNETFIVVRPPPAKSNHPLNLQLQLVPAHHSRDRSSTSAAATPTNSRPSTDLGQGTDSAQPSSSPTTSESDYALRRTPSTRSNRSDTSGFYASSMAVSAGSVTSFTSTASTASGRRMIIPLYNLSAHNVMTNTILDAGTDARVAKFSKRSLEIIDLAILEPTEVWFGKDHTHGAGVGAASDPLGVPIRRSFSGNSSLAPPRQNGSRAGTPDPSQSPGSSRISLSSDQSSVAAHPPTSGPVSIPTAAPTGTKKIFGRLFRRKESSDSQSSPSISVATVTPSPQKTVAPPTESLAAVPARRTAPSEVLLPAVLGLSPTLSAATNPPTGRCVSYVWLVRKWLKTDNHGIISGVLGKIGREASAHGIGHAGFPDGGDWEVRFEWVRGKSKGEKARRARRRLSMDVDARNRSITPSRPHSALLGLENVREPPNVNDGLAILIDSPRTSLDVKRPTSRAPSPRTDVSKAVSVTSTTNHSDDEVAGGHGEDGDESDPEDSETPWTCSMVLMHSSTPKTHLASVFTKGYSRTRTVSSSGAMQYPSISTPEDTPTFVSESGHVSGPTPIKFKVATLSPAPHHPKVVCQLKIPFPLPDAEVAHGVLRKRLVLADGSTRSTIPANRGPGTQSLTLTAEEIKDIVCSTAFWIVVREGFGGVGKKTRKGDGWKIRG